MVTFRLTVPPKSTAANQRARKYVSPGTAQVSLSVTNGTATLAYGPIACTTSCGGTFSVPVGNDTFTVTLLNSASLPLSIASITAQMQAGQTNVVNLTANPVVNAIALTRSGRITNGTPATFNIGVIAVDASGATIIGPGSFVDANGNALSINLTNSDLSGATTLTGSTITGPGQNAMVSYNGSTVQYTSIGATTSHPVLGTVTPTQLAPAGYITEFTAGITANSAPWMIVTGSDGNLWFTEHANNPNGNRIGRITPAGVVSEFNVPTGNSGPLGIGAGPDGNLWFAENAVNQIGRITTAGVITEFSAGITPGASPVGIVAGPDGNLWFTEQGIDRIGRITTAGVVTEFSAGITAGGSPNWIVAGPDGNLWFTEYNNPGGASRVGRITTAGVVTEFSAGITNGSGPNVITVGSDGNLWFSEYNGNGAIARVTTAGVVTEFTAGLTLGSAPYGIATGADGNLWFAEFANPGRISSITTAGTITEYTTGLTVNSGPEGIASGADGNLWFAENSVSKIGRIAP